MFRSPLKPFSVGPWPYFATLLNWNLLIYICYKKCRYVAVCQFIPSVCVGVCGYHLVETMSWNVLKYIP
jgi:hypothetical protein